MKRQVLIILILMIVKLSFTQNVGVDSLSLNNNQFNLENDGGKYGIKKGNELVLKCEYDSVILFRNSFENIILKKDNIWGYYDLIEKYWIIPMECSEITFVDSYYKDEFSKVLYTKAGKKGLMTFYGTEILSPKYDLINTTMSTWRYIVRQNGKYGVFNDGEPAEIAHTFMFDSIYSLNTDSLISLLQVEKNGKYGAIACENEYLEAIYDTIQYLWGTCGIESVKVKKNGNYGVVNIYNGEVLPAIYEEILFLSEQQFLVKRKGKYGLLKMDGNEIIPVKYESLEIFDNLYLLAKFKKEYYIFENNGIEISKIVADKVSYSGKDNDRGVWLFEIVKDGKVQNITINQY